MANGDIDAVTFGEFSGTCTLIKTAQPSTPATPDAAVPSTVLDAPETDSNNSDEGEDVVPFIFDDGDDY